MTDIVNWTVQKTGKLIVTVPEFKEYSGMDEGDSLTETMLKSAQEQIERACHVSFFPADVTVQYDGDETWKDLPVRPFISVTSVTAKHTTGNEAITDYEVVGTDYNKQIYVPKVWRLSAGRISTVVEVVYKAGYQSNNDVPEPLKEAIMLTTMKSLERRFSLDVPNLKEVKALIAPYMRLYV